MALGIIGLLISLALLMYFAYKGTSVIIIAPLLALLAALFGTGINTKFMANYTEVYMVGFANYIKSYFPLYVTGAIFAILMDAADYTKSIAHFIVNKLGKNKAILAIVIAGAILTYGGVSLFVVAFVLYPLAVVLFREADIPKRLIPASIALSAFTFTMTALPGTPQVPNTIPMAYFGTDSFAAPVLGIIAAAVMFGLGVWWLTYRANAAKKVGEGYGNYDDAISNQDNDSTPMPSTFISILPIITIVILNLFFSKVYYPSIDGSYLKNYKTVLSKVSGNWSVILALIFSIILIIAINYKKLVKKGLNVILKKGVSNSFSPLICSSAVVGFGSIIKSVSAYMVIQNFILSLSKNPLISEALSINLLCGLTASASGGLGAALEALAKTYIQMGAKVGIPAAVLHRVASVASCGLDALPFNGAVITTLSICGLTHKQSYKDIFVTSAIVPIIAMIVIIVLATLGVRC